MMWVQFAVSAALILYAGTYLTRYADRLCDALGLGKVWIGVVLLGFVTSLPEAGSSMVALLQLHAPDLAVGNMLGSNNFNLLLLVFLDLFYRKGAVTDLISCGRAQRVPAYFAIFLTSLVGMEIWMGQQRTLPAVLGIGWGSWAVCLGYIAGMRAVYQSNPGVCGSDRQECLAGSRNGLGGIYGGLFISGVVVVAAAVWLANTADQIAQVTGWGRTFVGSLFLAMATSLPEMVVTLSALKLGQMDLAIGNIFGSNMVNMFLLFVCDVFVRSGALLGMVSGSHLWTVVIGIVMTAVAFAGLRYKGKVTFFALGWDTWTLFVLYGLGMAVLYQLRS
ncbi:MAG TPA: hypothetical protein P5160_01305 [Candidatus Omnitrophota bacterium]|nr:hypothetical protein [Candidatus Omnitrophota bacterium]